jgi:hypothetical protein
MRFACSTAASLALLWSSNSQRQTTDGLSPWKHTVHIGPSRPTVFSIQTLPTLRHPIHQQVGIDKFLEGRD